MARTYTFRQWSGPDDVRSGSLEWASILNEWADLFSDAGYSGALNAATGTFTGALSAATGTFSGELVAATGTFAGSLSAATGTFAGSLSAATGTFAGSLSAATGTFAGSLSAATGTFAGSLSAATGTFVGGVTATALDLKSGSSVIGSFAITATGFTIDDLSGGAGIDFDGSGGVGNGILSLIGPGGVNLNSAAITTGANDSGGAGFKLLRVPN